jgi:hypothetical protein
MTDRTTPPTEFVNSERSQGMQDVLLVSTFGLWVGLLGLMPVVALRLFA